jgi:hypothetical protein
LKLYYQFLQLPSLEKMVLPMRQIRSIEELTPQQKQENQQLSRERVKCENAFTGVKRYNTVAQVYRNRVPGFDDKLMLTACGLWNFYLMAA